MAAIPNIKNLDLKQLQELSERVGERIEDIKIEAEEKFIADMKKRASDEGLDYSKIVKSMKRTKSKGVAAPKYRDPKTGNTWSGRGRKPTWFIEAIEQGGKTLKELEI